MNNTEASLRTAPGVDAFIVGDEWLLFSQTAQAMFRLNTSAAFIWACIEEGLNAADIRAGFAEAFSLDAAHADRDVAAITSEWRTLGLLESGDTPRRAAVVDEALNSPTPAYPAASIDENAFAFERYYRLLDTVIRIRYCDSDTQAAVDAVLMPAGAVPKQREDISIDLWREGKACIVLENGKPVAQCHTLETLPPVLLAQVAAAAYLNTECLIGVHAAAVTQDNDCIIFPAVSGSGKSTLTAALVASGYQYGTDELVLIKSGSHQALTAPLGMSLKPGSWPALRNYYPDLDTLPVYLRLDDKQVRYLLPQHSSPALTGSAKNKVCALVFPSYQPGSPACLADITTADALCRLTEAGYDVGGGLDRDSVAELVAWMRQQDCYELLFSDLEEAVARVGELLP